MNNKGFTLLEVMGVLLLLVVILLVTIPNITNTIKKTNMDKMEDYEKTICLAAETYIAQEEIKISGSLEIKGTTLVSKNYLSDSLTNPETKKRVITDSVIVKLDSDNAIVCNLKG